MNVPGNVSGGHTEARRGSKKSHGDTEGWRKLICRAVIRNIGRREINEWTMTQWGRQLFGGRNTLKGGEMGRRRVGKERTTDRDREQLGENENKEREREGGMDGWREEGGDETKGKLSSVAPPVSASVPHTVSDTEFWCAVNTTRTCKHTDGETLNKWKWYWSRKGKADPHIPQLVIQFGPKSLCLCHICCQDMHASCSPTNEGDLLAVVREFAGHRRPEHGQMD